MTNILDLQGLEVDGLAFGAETCPSSKSVVIIVTQR
ncbi:hypothetical protein EV193_101182 [Herbihabitans rhizosphaerae]|uniref:Uncharacterized protein n=1 Tax=Herbihabitans rhizosphaerae TaxID=1872711 RepID=A0A4Q7L4U6_9PSEU|nr:hypothetical protein EV193_101182 [Herbihabitans rhizosphaerae]